ncbi:MAG: hypothetical protein JNM70_21190 [Anaerolineae bacterium]|nr:hypothetical protein [Anaerolineae bacterium]
MGGTNGVPQYPRVHLAVDNCFASKRWTAPLDWMRIAREAGLYCVEASADNECDPLYTTAESLASWIDDVKRASEQTGVRVSTFYSGHGSYATLGLAHPDERVREHMQRRWLEPMIASAASLQAGLGFFCHAFPQAVLADPTAYAEAEADLFRRLAELAVVGQRVGLSSLSVEQMYVPHQVPWTIRGAERLLKAVYEQGKAPFYITLDTGHQVGQKHYQKPSIGQIEAVVTARRRGDDLPDVWLGPVEIAPDCQKAGAVEEWQRRIEARPYLFAEGEDGDVYAWLRRLGRYSPIIHLQQTDGSASAHRPFTEAFNRSGIIHAEQVLMALYESCSQLAISGNEMPPVEDIYLTIEMFSGTAERPARILANLRETAAYWRRFVPEDGMRLDEIRQHIATTHQEQQPL